MVRKWCSKSWQPRKALKHITTSTSHAAKSAEVSGVEVVPHQRFATSPFEYYPSDNAGKHFVAILDTPKPLTPEADCVRLLDHNAITVTPLLLQQTDMKELKRLSGAFQFSKVSHNAG